MAGVAALIPFLSKLGPAAKASLMAKLPAAGVGAAALGLGTAMGNEALRHLGAPTNVRELGEFMSSVGAEAPKSGGLSAAQIAEIEKLLGAMSDDDIQSTVDKETPIKEKMGKIVGEGHSRVSPQRRNKRASASMGGHYPSDEDIKYIGDKISKKEKFTGDDIGRMEKAFPEFTQGMFEWKDETLKGFADWIKNYPYTYKEEAKEVDPSLDSTTEHIGPMAQDIEKVVPAAVVPDPKTGYKTVDTPRLSLATAGAVSALAEETADTFDKILKELQELRRSK
jgi:hypothetical protein